MRFTFGGEDRHCTTRVFEFKREISNPQDTLHALPGEAFATILHHAGLVPVRGLVIGQQRPALQERISRLPERECIPDTPGIDCLTNELLAGLYVRPDHRLADE